MTPYHNQGFLLPLGDFSCERTNATRATPASSLERKGMDTEIGSWKRPRIKDSGSGRSRFEPLEAHIGSLQVYYGGLTLGSAKG